MTLLRSHVDVEARRGRARSNRVDKGRMTEHVLAVQIRKFGRGSEDCTHKNIPPFPSFLFSFLISVTIILNSGEPLKRKERVRRTALTKQCQVDIPLIPGDHGRHGRGGGARGMMTAVAAAAVRTRATRCARPSTFPSPPRSLAAGLLSRFAQIVSTADKICLLHRYRY